MVYIGADHNGFWLKQELKTYLQRHKIVVIDVGAHSRRVDDDYPDYAFAMGRKFKIGDLGILICGSGHGMVIAGNKLKGLRASLATTVFSARKARSDDHVNILVLSAWETSVEQAKRIVAAWLSAKPSKAYRHQRRLQKIKRWEK